MARTDLRKGNKLAGKKERETWGITCPPRHRRPRQKKCILGQRPTSGEILNWSSQKKITGANEPLEINKKIKGGPLCMFGMGMNFGGESIDQSFKREAQTTWVGRRTEKPVSGGEKLGPTPNQKKDEHNEREKYWVNQDCLSRLLSGRKWRFRTAWTCEVAVCRPKARQRRG